MKRYFAFLLALVFVLAVAGCARAEAAKMIYVLTPEPDRGWMGAAGAYIDEVCDALNAEGRIEAVHLNSSNAEEQLAQVEEIIAAGANAKSAALVIMPHDASLENAVSKMSGAGIAYILADQNPCFAAIGAVACFRCDNMQTGAAAAACLVEKGMQEGDKCIVFEGENAYAAMEISEGFRLYLIGAIAVNDEYIAEPWSSLDAITFSGALNSSRPDSCQFFEAYMSDAANADTKYLAGWDDGCLLGLLDALEGSAIDSRTGEMFLSGGPCAVSCGGSETICSLLRGDSAESAGAAARFSGFMMVSCTPEMGGEAIRVLADYMDGKEIAQENLLPVNTYTAENIDALYAWG